MKASEDIIELSPTLVGRHGRAWKSDLEVARKELPQLKEEASVCTWFIEAEWAHPAWHSYVLFVIHLRHIEDAPPPIIYLEGATHEILLFALDPDVAREPQIRKCIVSRLEPANFGAQFIVESDEAAAKRAEGAVVEILEGILSPDTDFIREWIKRFGDNMVRKGEGL